MSAAPDEWTNAIAAIGSGGFLFVVARWLWHYEQVVTSLYEEELRSSHEQRDELKGQLDAETSARRAAEEESSRLRRLLLMGGIDPGPHLPPPPAPAPAPAPPTA